MPVDLKGWFTALDRIAGAKESLARRMGVTGSEIWRDEARMRAPVGDHIDGSKNPGLLRDSIRHAFNKRDSNSNRFVYSVSWNHRRAPHGHLIEFGHWMPYMYGTDGLGNFWTYKDRPMPGGPKWIAAQPFLGPAYGARFNDVRIAMIERGRQELPNLLKGE